MYRFQTTQHDSGIEHHCGLCADTDHVSDLWPILWLCTSLVPATSELVYGSLWSGRRMLLSVRLA